MKILCEGTGAEDATFAIGTVRGPAAGGSTPTTTYCAAQPPASIVAHGLGVAETVSLLVSYTSTGQDFTPVVVGGVPVMLTKDHNVAGIFAPGVYKVEKSATSAPVTVALATSS